MAKPYFWIIGGGLLQVPLIKEARKLDLSIIVSDLNKNCVCRNLSDIFVHKDIFDIQGHIKEAKKIIQGGRKIAGVLAAGIDAPETMAALAEELNLPGVKRSAAHLTHNKHKFRKKLKELGYPTPKFQIISLKDIQRLNSMVDRVGFPLIVKNTDSSGSRGTKIFYKKDLAEIKKTAREAIRVSKSGKALIEECWEGPEQTVETIFDIEGNFHSCFITDRIFDRRNGVAMEIELRNPTNLPLKIQKEMFAIAHNVARDLGITIGAAKYDMMLTKDGPRIIEMTTRLSGGFDCQYLVPYATGKNVMKAAILTALGKKFPLSLLKNTQKKVGLSGSIFPRPGRIIEIEGIDKAKQIPGVEEIFFRYKVGDIIEPYTDCAKRVCFIITTTRSETEARKALQKAQRTIKIITR